MPVRVRAGAGECGAAAGRPRPTAITRPWVAALAALTRVRVGAVGTATSGRVERAGRRVRRSRRAANGTSPRQVAPIAVSTTPTPPEESTPAVSAPTPPNAPTHSVVPTADQPRNRPNGIRTVPATIGTTAWITATKRTATSADAPFSRR